MSSPVVIQESESQKVIARMERMRLCFWTGTELQKGIEVLQTEAPYVAKDEIDLLIKELGSR